MMDNSSKIDQRLLEAASSKDGAQHVLYWLRVEDPVLYGATAQGNTALHLAIRFGNHRFAARIQELCPNLLWSQNVNGETPLHCAAACGWPHICRWAEALITSLNVHNGVRKIFWISNYQGETALHVALKNRNETMAKTLLNADNGLSNCINKAGESVIYLAASFGSVDIVKKLLESPSTADHTGFLGRSPLHGAIRAGNIDVAEAILNVRPEDIKRTDQNGSTPLHYAVLQNHLCLVEILLSCDPSTAYTKDGNSRSPAHLAAQMGFTEVLEKILDYSPDCIDVVDAKGRNILHVAADCGKPGVAKHILKRCRLVGVVNQQDANGDTPLHIVSSKCVVHVLKQLITAGDILNRRLENHEGHMAIESLPRDADKEVYLKYVEVSRVLCNLYSKGDISTVETHRKRLSDTTERFIRIVYADRMEKKSLIAAFIATITFTAAFSVPGGYFDDDGPEQGVAILTRKSAFKTFIVFDTLALVFSLLAVILATSTKEWTGSYFKIMLASANELLPNSLIAVTMAFGTGVYVVVAPLSPSLAIFVLATCCLSVLVHCFVRFWLAFKLGYRLDLITLVVNKLKECMEGY